VGASAVIYEAGQPGHTDRKARLGDEVDHTSYEAELVGALIDHTSYEAELVGALIAVHLAANVPPGCAVSIYLRQHGSLTAERCLAADVAYDQHRRSTRFRVELQY
jgi:hypothetical protein